MNPETNSTPSSEVNPQINPEPQPVTPPGHNLFWVLVAVFAVLALDAALRLSDLLAQRRQMDQARFAQSQNLGKLAEAEQAKVRLHALAFDVAQVSVTNETARRIVQDFNIRFPGFPVVAPVSAPTSPPPVPSNPAPAPASLLSAPNDLPASSPGLLSLPSNAPAAVPSPLPSASNAPSLR